MRTRFFVSGGWRLFELLVIVLLFTHVKTAAAGESDSAIGLWQDADATFEIYDEHGTLTRLSLLDAEIGYFSGKIDCGGA